MNPLLQPLARSTFLREGMCATRRDRNRAYLMRLAPHNLLLAHRFEAGLFSFNSGRPEGIHWGWDGPLSHLRGAFVGHWLSAAARIFDETRDQELKSRADGIVTEIARCQAENGGEWCFPIPERYLEWLKRGKRIWAPLYVCHKTLMGLLDMHVFAGSEQALDILGRAAAWFTRYTDGISRAQMTAMMSQEETGGLMELWADLYAVTKEPGHLELMRRFERPELFEPLLRGEDVLTNQHANATIPEVHGAARAYEVTGEERYRRIVESYWDLAVRRRGTFATGGQTSGEIWTPIGRHAARLGDLTQEHCTVYNLMRLAEYLLRCTGAAEYADYWERNLYNGILAQGYWEGRSLDTVGEPPVPPTGLISYFLPLAAGSRKRWGSETEDFWCCHGTLVQANANHREGIYYRDADGLRVCQFVPSRVDVDVDGVPVTLEQRLDGRTGGILRIHPVNREVSDRPEELRFSLTVEAKSPVAFSLRIRIPWWAKGPMLLEEDGRQVAWQQHGEGWASLTRTWGKHELTVSIPRGLTCWPLPDRPGVVAFLDGPVVLAGLVGEERMLRGDPSDPATMLTPDDERHWATWKPGWRTANQPVGWRFKPLYEIGNETYTVYFPVARPEVLP